MGVAFAMRKLTEFELESVAGGDLTVGGFSGSGVFTSDSAADMGSAASSSAEDLNVDFPSCFDNTWLPSTLET